MDNYPGTYRCDPIGGHRMGHNDARRIKRKYKKITIKFCYYEKRY